MSSQVLPSLPDEPPHPKLRVTHLTLFSHGVASLKLRATVTDNAELTLSFPPDIVNDVLKSLTAVDKSANGTIASISYNSPHASSGSIMSSFYEKSGAFHSILSEACGTAVTLVFKLGQRESGVLAGLQKDEVVEGNGKRIPNIKIALVKSEDNFKVSIYSLQDVTDVIIDDESFQSKLKNTLHSRKVTEKDMNKQIFIHAAGSGERDIEVCYAIESPVYKFTYRFLFSESSEQVESGDGEEIHGEQLLIQAWVLVDNPSEEDLQDVQLSIMSGMPISFQHDLYSARFVDRPKEEINSKKIAYNAPSAANVSKSRSRFLDVLDYDSEEEEEEDMDFDLFDGNDFISNEREKDQETSGSASKPLPQGNFGGEVEHSKTEQVGSLFEYHIKQKVRIGGKQSALVPVVQKTVQGGRVSIYSKKVTRSNTLAAVKLINDTDAPFESGPASIYEGDGRLIGEAMVDTCAPQAEVLLPYSVELDCPASHECIQQPSEITSLSINDGSLRRTNTVTDKEVYTFWNNKKTDMKLYVWHDMKEKFKAHKATVSFENMKECEEQEHRERGGTESEISAERTEERRVRFYIDLKSGQRCKLNVISAKTWDDKRLVETICDDDTVTQYENQGLIDAKMKEKLKNVIDAMQNVSKKKNDHQARKKQRDEIQNSQVRIRQNISSLSNVQQLAGVDDNRLLLRYIQSLESSENSIEDLESQIEKLKAEVDAEQEKVNKMMKKLRSE